MRNALNARFPPFKSEEQLRSAIESICAKFGAMRNLRILPASRESPEDRPRCLCFLELESLEAESALRLELEVEQYGTNLAFVADVDDEYPIRSWI